jgi:hypothetical protein
MDEHASPGRGGAPAAQPAHPQNANLEATSILDSEPAGNRKLIKSDHGFDLFEVQERRRKFHYEITDGNRCWSFPLLWSAFLKFDRLVTKREARRGHE